MDHPPAYDDRAPILHSHRGSTVLTLGILSLVLSGCAVVGITLAIIAIAMSGKDLRGMDEGFVDPEGRSMTQAGRICAIIGACLGGISLCFWIFYALVLMLAIAGGAAAP
ncbi:MAG: hypothetical protein VYC34_12435 [Planctomycetota bacterium]|nr:hypothetical protein [Planctomycetota bacterium]